MEKITLWITKHKNTLIITFMFLIWMNGCQTNRNLTNEISTIKQTQTQILRVNDSILQLNKEIPTRNYVSSYFEIEGYRISKRILYDNNLIVRTKERPDDRMMEYDNEIEKIKQNVKVVK